MGTVEPAGRDAQNRAANRIQGQPPSAASPSVWTADEHGRRPRSLGAPGAPAVPDQRRPGRERHDGQRRRRHRHRPLELLPVGVVVLVAEVGDDGERVDQAQPERQRAAPGVGHGVGQDHGARAGPGHHGPAGEGLQERLEDGRPLEHGAQVQRRAPREVDETGAGQDGGHAGVLGRGPVHHHESLDLGAQRLEPLGRLEDDPLGVLVGGGGRQDDHIGPSGGRQQGGVEGAALGPFIAPDQGQRAGRVHGATLACPATPPLVRSASTPVVTDR